MACIAEISAHGHESSDGTVDYGHLVRGGVAGVASVIELVESIMDRWRIVRRSIVYFTLVLTAYATHQAFILAFSSDMEPLGLAAVIGAIMAPLSYFAKAVATEYFTMRRDVELG